MLLGLKIEIHEKNELRVKIGLSRTETPHITTTYMWRKVYKRCLKPVTGGVNYSEKKEFREGAEEHQGTVSFGEQKGEVRIS